jgi:hypothetical protein
MSLGFGVDMPAGNRVRISGEATDREFDRAPRALTGSAEVMVVPADRLELRVGVSREQQLSSRLSLSGEEQGGVFYGPAFATEIVTGTTVHPARGWDIWANVLNGRTRGQNIQSNGHAKAFAGVGKTVSVGRASVRSGYALAWMSYQRDLSGYPATDLGGDGVSRRGVGGYFSPSRFSNHSLRVDVTLPVTESLLLVGGASAGRQSVRDVGTGERSDVRPSSDDYLGFRLQMGGRVSVRGQVDYQNVASAFNRTTMRVTCAYGF